MLRLDRWLVTLGVGSRSQVQKLIRQGAVTVGGAVVTDPSASCDTNAELTLHRQKLDGRLTRHVMLHKPGGLLTAARDKKQPTVMDLLPEAYASIGCMPVGRLDKDTTGLLLITDDGKAAHGLISPKSGVEKRYRALLDAPATQADVEAFARGLSLSDFEALPAKLEIGEGNVAWCTVQEGKFHQVKRMFAAVGHPVLRLSRLMVAGIWLDEALAPGEWRELTSEEINHLYKAAGMKE